MFNFQLAACSSLCYLFQESSFSELDLFECLPTCWTMSFKLIEDVQEFDSKVCVSKAQFCVLLQLVFDLMLLYAPELHIVLLVNTMRSKVSQEAMNACIRQDV